MYKLKKIAGSNNFSAQLIKIISHHKRLAIPFMFCNRLHAWWSTNSCKLCFPLLLQASRSEFWLYDGSDLKTYLLMRWQGPDVLVVGFLLLGYSVLCTIDSLSLLYLLLRLILKKNVGLPCSYLPIQNRPYSKIELPVWEFFFSLILLTNPSLTSLKAVI